MNGGAAKRLVCRCAAALLDPKAGHLNAFVYTDNEGNDRPEAERAWRESRCTR